MAYQQNRDPIYCRDCENNGIKTELAFSKLQKSASGKSIPLDKSTMKPHQCPYSAYARKQDIQQQMGLSGNYSPQGQKEFVEQYRPSQPQQPIANPKAFPTFDEVIAKLDKIMTLVQTMNIGINNYLNEPTVVENRILKAKVNELQALVADREDNFVPANKVKQPEPDSYAIRPGTNTEMTTTDEHVQRMVKKGEQAEELDLT